MYISALYFPTNSLLSLKLPRTKVGVGISTMRLTADGLELEEHAINDVEIMPLIFCFHSEERGWCKNEALLKSARELLE